MVWLWMSSASCFSSPVFIAEQLPCNIGYPFGQLGSAVPAVAPCSSLCTPSLLAGRAAWGAAKALTLCKHCSAAAKTSLCHQCCFGHKSETQHRKSYCEEDELDFSQTQYNDFFKGEGTIKKCSLILPVAMIGKKWWKITLLQRTNGWVRFLFGRAYLYRLLWGTQSSSYQYLLLPTFAFYFSFIFWIVKRFHCLSI